MLGIRRRHTGFAPVLPVLLVTAGITPMAAAHAVAATAPPVSGPTRASVASGGGDADGVSDQTALSGNGRYVAFRSDATNLVAGDTNGVGDVFVRDLRRNTTTLVSVGRHRAPADGASSEPAISRNGQFVAFTSEATNLVRNDTNGVADVFVRDLQTGRTERVSVAGRHQQLTFASAQPDISSNGKFVAFVIRSSTDSNPDESVAVRDRFQHKTTVEDSGPAACPIAGSPRTVRSPSLGANGRYLAFAISCLASTVNRVLELDRPSGTWTEIATMMPPYTAYGEFTWTRYSADANTLAWTSLVASLREFRAGLHVHERVARYLPPNFASTSVAVRRPDLSGDGRFLAYAGGYGNSANGASLLDNAVHVMDRADDSIVEASAPTVDTQRVAGYASEPAIDDSGAIVGFSTEEALVSGDTNSVRDVYANSRAAAPPSAVPTLLVYTALSVDEPDTGATTQPFAIVLAAGKTGTTDVPITWHTVDGTAHAPDDYDAVTNATALVPPEADHADLPIVIRGDTLAEGDEAFRVLVEALAGVRVIYVNGTITIHDND